MLFWISCFNSHVAQWCTLQTLTRICFIWLCDTLRETNIGRIYSLQDTLMSPGRRRWRGRPVLGRICPRVLLTTLATGSKYNLQPMQSNNSFVILIECICLFSVKLVLIFCYLSFSITGNSIFKLQLQLLLFDASPSISTHSTASHERLL